MRVAMTGSSGLVGRALAERLREGGHRVLRLVRRAARGDDEIEWDPAAHRIDTDRLEGVEAVIHLAGESVFSLRWTEAKKRRIRDSRVHGTRLLAEGLAQLEKPPRVLLCASAIGFYGEGGDTEFTESSPAGEGFLVRTCVEWEAAADPARAAGIPVSHVRIGVVLSPEGGALQKMLPAFRFGLGGRLGSGRHYVSWIHIDDLVGIFEALVQAAAGDASRASGDPFDLPGVVNAVAPHPVDNREFTRVLAGVLRRPAFFPVPAFGMRLLMGEVVDEVLLASIRVKPERLIDMGFEFGHPQLDPALRDLLGIAAPPQSASSVARG